MNKGLFFIVFFVSWLSLAQSPDDLFREANNAYNKGEYARAIVYYDSVLTQGVHAAEVYYNLGNAHYKRNAIAPSILNYERALLMDPANEDVLNNLVFAQNMTLDRFTPLPESDIKQISSKLLSLTNVHGWSIIAIVSCWVAALLFFLYIKSSRSVFKRLYFTGFLLLVLGVVLSVSIALYQKDVQQNTHPAIVFAQTESFRSEPNLRAEVLLTIHEGTKVYVLENLEDWVKIKLINGAIGWIPQSSITYIRPTTE